MIRRWLLFLVGLAVSVAACVWIAHRTDLSEALHALRRLSPEGVCVIVLSYTLGFVPRAFRSVFMCGKELPCRPKVAAESVILGYAANNLLPLRLGEIVRTLFFSARTGTARTTALALVAAERFLDALFLGFVLCGALAGFALSARGMPATYHALFLPAAILSFLGLSIVVAMICFQPVLKRFLEKLHWATARALGQRVLEALTFLREPDRLWRVSVLSALVWLCEGGLFAGTAWALGLPQPLLAGYLALAVVNLGILIPSSPGYVGVFHAAALFALQPLGVAPADALAFALVTHALPYILVTSTGVGIFIRHHRLFTAMKWRQAPSE